MTIRALHSRASIKGHPIHPMIVAFPIGLYTAGVVSLIVFAARMDPFWYRASMWTMLAGVVMAGVAAVFGSVDLFLGVPREEKATRKTGYIHFGLNVLTLLLFLGAGLSLASNWRSPQNTGPGANLHYGLPLVLGLIGTCTLLAAGWFGWKLVQTHHIGIEDTGERAFEPAHAGSRS